MFNENKVFFNISKLEKTIRVKDALVEGKEWGSGGFSNNNVSVPPLQEARK